MFLAAVLFLVGIGSTFKLHTIRYVLITIGSLLLILATVLILLQPGPPRLTARSRRRLAPTRPGLLGCYCLAAPGI